MYILQFFNRFYDSQVVWFWCCIVYVVSLIGYFFLTTNQKSICIHEYCNTVNVIIKVVSTYIYGKIWEVGSGLYTVHLIVLWLHRKNRYIIRDESHDSLCTSQCMDSAYYYSSWFLSHYILPDSTICDSHFLCYIYIHM